MMTDSEKEIIYQLSRIADALEVLVRIRLDGEEDV